MPLKRVIPSVLIIYSLILVSCNPYQKLLKSGDINLKYSRAEEYFNKGDYKKALPLLEDVAPSFVGTAKSESITYYLAYSYFKTGQYQLASFEFKNLADAYPLSDKLEDSYFYYAYSLYLDSPIKDLDQKATYDAIQAFALYLTKFPDSKKVEEINGYLDILSAKLEQKAVDNALLYYKTEDYKAAVWALKNVLNEYPATNQKEKISFLIEKSAYLLARNSIENKKAERYRSAIQYYNDFKEKYPMSKYLVEADKIAKESNSYLNKQKKL